MKGNESAMSVVQLLTKDGDEESRKKRDKIAEEKAKIKHAAHTTKFGATELTNAEKLALDVEVLFIGTLAEKEGMSERLKVLSETEAMIHISEVVIALLKLANVCCASARENSIVTLANIAAKNPAHRGEIAEAGAIPLLLDMLLHGTDSGQAQALRTLVHLAGFAFDFSSTGEEGHTERRRDEEVMTNSALGKSLFDLLQAASEEVSLHAPSTVKLLSPAHLQEVCPVLIPYLSFSLQLGSAELQTKAAEALHGVATSDKENKQKIADTGAAEDLVSLLKNSTEKCRSMAVMTLAELAKEEAGGIKVVPPLHELLKDTADRPSEVKEKAARAMGNLAINGQNLQKLMDADVILYLVEVLRNGLPQAQEQAASALWKASCMGSSALNAESQKKIADAGAIPVLIDLLHHPELGLQLRAARMLKVLASHGEIKKKIVDANALPHFVKLLGNGLSPLLEQTERGRKRQRAAAAMKEEAAGFFSNLAEDNPTNQTLIVAFDTIPPLVTLLSNVKSSSGKQAAAALKSLAKKNPANMQKISDAGAISILVDALSKDENSAEPGVYYPEQACAALACLADGHGENQAKISKAGAIVKVVELLKSGDSRVMVEATGALAVMASNNERRTAIADAGAIWPIVEQLRTGNQKQIEKAALAVSMLAKDHQDNGKAIRHIEAVRTLVEHVHSGPASSKENVEEALRALGVDPEVARRKHASDYDRNKVHRSNQEELGDINLNSGDINLNSNDGEKDH